MKSILVPISSFENGLAPLTYAIDFAAQTNSKIYILKTYGPNLISGSIKTVGSLLEEEAKKEIKALVKAVDTKNVEIIATVVKGSLYENILAMSKSVTIDLIISASNRISKDETIFIGKITGSIIRQIDCPILVVPPNYVFQPIKSVLMAIKSGVIKREGILDPLISLLDSFQAKLDLLQVITPKFKDEDMQIDPKLQALVSNSTSTENATIYQGVLEHLNAHKPNMLCVIKRKRGFFSKLWEQDSIKKIDFESRIPLLILRGAM
jgi:nucleotide-binding universal stress UspA family protein